MSYSTTLYAIDLKVLEAAIGCRDSGLIDRVAVAEADSTGVPDRKELRIQILEDGTILLDGNAGDLNAVIDAYSALSDADAVRFLSRNTESQKAVFAAFSEVVSKKARAAKINLYPASTTEAEFWADPDEPPPESGDDGIAKAVASLVNGKISRRIETADYGYALERLCRALGKRLDADDALADLESLRLDSPLTEPRAFAKVPHDDDFPVISYLTADEVRQESSRLDRLDLAFPEDEDIEQGRRSYAAAIGSAAARGLAVITFYY